MASDPPQPGDTVKLRYDAAGLPAGTEGALIGWYAGESWEALVRFGAGEAVRVPADSIEDAMGNTIALVCVECGAVALPHTRGWWRRLVPGKTPARYCPVCAKREFDSSGK